MSVPLAKDHLPTPMTLTSLPMVSTDYTEKDHSKDDYENVVTCGYRVLAQDKVVDRQELITKEIINDHRKSYSKNKPDMDLGDKCTLFKVKYFEKGTFVS